MKIAQFGDSFPPIMDGPCVTMMNYAKWLNEKYGECTVIAPRVRGYIDKTPYKVYRFPSVSTVIRKPYRIGVPGLDHRFYKEMHTLKCDLVHAHSPYIAGEQALKVAQRLNIPLIVTFHSKFRDDFKAALKMDVIADMAVKHAISFFDKADYVWTVNAHTEEALRSYGYKGPVEIVPNGCDIREIKDPSAAIRSINDEYSIAPEDNVFIFVGQQVWIKNIKLILDAAQIYFKTHGGRLILIGEGNDAAEIRKYAAANEVLRDRVIFTGKILDRDKLYAFYLRAKALMFPSIYDNAPLVVREAAYMGCPPILARNSNAAEDFLENEEVFLTEVSPEALAEKMQMIADDTELYETVKQGCRKIALPWETVVESVAKRYSEIIQEWTGKRKASGA